MKRREFIMLLGGASAAWPLSVRAQQGERMRRIGVLILQAADDPESQDRIAAFSQGLHESGWIVGRNVQFEYRWGAGDADRVRRYAAELVALAPDVIVTSGGSTVPPLLQATRTVPIVFVNVAEPVGGGLVDSLSRPGGNATGFVQFEYGLSGKWLELLKQVVPGVTRVAVIRDPALVAGIGTFAVTSVSSRNHASCSAPPGMTTTSPGSQARCSLPRRNSILPLSIHTICSFA
jgi:putative ABC transport system substrate-binding protein